MPNAFDKLMTPGSGRTPDRPVPANGGKTSIGTTSSAGQKRSSTTPLVEDEGQAGPSKKLKVLAHSADRSSGSSESPVRRTSVAGFLNSLTDDEARALDRVMRSSLSSRIAATPILSAVVRQQLLSLRGLEDGSTHDGWWWANLTSCEVVGISSGADHPRWQIDIDGAGIASNMTLVKGILSEHSLDSLKASATTGAKKVVKLPCHHVAYNADLSRRDTAPLPLNAGAGGSLSHLCDRKGCVRASHLEVANEHASNLQRQRCQGPSLLVFRGVIVQETSCVHAQGATELARLQNSCLGSLRLDILGESSARAVSSILGSSQ